MNQSARLWLMERTAYFEVKNNSTNRFTLTIPFSCVVFSVLTQESIFLPFCLSSTSFSVTFQNGIVCTRLALNRSPLCISISEGFERTNKKCKICKKYLCFMFFYINCKTFVTTSTTFDCLTHLRPCNWNFICDERSVSVKHTFNCFFVLDRAGLVVRLLIN